MPMSNAMTAFLKMEALVPVDIIVALHVAME
jgi:hypothetical protein